MTLLYTEDTNLGLELITVAQELSSKHITIVATPSQVEAYKKTPIQTLIKITNPLEHQKAEETAAMLADIHKEHSNEEFLIGSTRHGREVAARLAGLLDCSCAIDATHISKEKEGIQVQRNIYSGNAIATLLLTTTPAIITVPKKAYKPTTTDDNATEIIEYQATYPETMSKITDISKKAGEDINVEEADIIVSCGRGLKNKEDIKLIEDLAEATGGKTVGCSRPLAADLKWLSEDHWIGLSGHKVKPKLYIATGISGQVQHIAGMREAGIILAINKDPDALIFNSADYGIIGDLYEVVPKLTEAIKKKRA